MNPKSATAFLAVSILVVGDFLLEHNESLVPPAHVHAEMRTELGTFKSLQSLHGVHLAPIMQSVMRTVKNGVVGHTFMYEVYLSFDKTLQIIHHANHGTGYQFCWQVRRIEGGISGEWTGKFASAEQAALQS